MKFLQLLLCFTIGISLLTVDITQAQTTVTIGMGSSSSSTRGPFQRADTNSTTVFSRFIQVYTQAELASVGVTNGVNITEVAWELASSNIIIGSGDATMKIYVKNSSATQAMSDTWANHIMGATMVLDESFNTTNNFPGANGWMPFTFSSPYVYTGGALEIMVDWDCSQVTTPAFNGNGAIKFRWESTAPDFLVVKKTSSSAPSTTISDLKDERANIQITYTAAGCGEPTGIFANNVMTTSADFNWSAPSGGATSYTWKVVAAGAGPGATAVDGGTTASTMASSTSLAAFTAYDLFVESDCGATGTSGFAGPYSFLTMATNSATATVGMGTSSSSTRGPFQRSDTNSSTVYSRFVHIYTAAELAAAGLTNGNELSALNWELASSNQIIGNGDATLKVYIKNSSATAATADSWGNLIAGSTLAVDNAYNTNNNFPGANGWMAFNFSAPFVYTGGALEVAVDWDCSQVSTPAFNGDGSLKWRWESTAPDFLVVKKTSSSAPSSNISDLKDERANIQFVYNMPICNAPSGLNASNITSTSADLSWSDTLATSFNWRLVLAGAGVTSMAVDSGTTATTATTSTMLTAVTSYDLYVEAECSGIGTSGFEGPYNFTTLCAATPATMISTEITSVSCNGGSDGAINLTVTAGVPSYGFAWSNSDTTEDISGLSAGLYTVTIIDGDGCPYFDSVMVVEPTALVLMTTVIADTANAGIGAASVAVTGGTPPYAYAWNGAAGSADTTGLTVGTYQVVITDANGCVDSASVMVDDIVGITEIDFLSNLSISPNPTTGMAGLAVELTKNAEVSVSVYSIRGELIETIAKENTNQLNHQIDLSNYANGLYFVRFEIDKQAITKKLVLHK